MKRIAVFVVVAALLLTPLDFLQAVFGVRTFGTSYWLTPIEFAAVGAALGLLSFSIDPAPHRARRGAVLVHLLLFVFAYASTLFMGDEAGFAIAASFVLQDVISDVFFGVRFGEVFPFALLLGIVGPGIEWIEVQRGEFSYPATQGTIPKWLPLLWLSGSFLVRALVGRTRKEPRAEWFARFLTFVAPFARAVATVVFAFSPTQVRRLGFVGAWKMALRVYGWRRS